MFRFTTPKIAKICGILFSALLLSACSLYRPELRQGNHITQAELDKLQPGMEKIQVQQIMGSPVTTPIFEVEHWNYTYAYVKGTQRDKQLRFKTITLYFKNDRLQGYSSQYWHPANLSKVN